MPARDTGTILFFLCLNDRGGAEISMIRLAQGLAESGRRVTLAVYGGHPYLGRKLGFTGEIVELGCVRTWAALMPLCRLLYKRDFPILISALTHTNIAAIFAARLASRRTRVIATEHSIDGVDAFKARKWFARLTCFAYQRVAALVAVSHVLAAHWHGLMPDNVNVTAIYNPVVEDVASAGPPPAHIWLGDKTIPVAIGIGRLKEEKNFALLIRAFAAVAQTRAVRLVILGEGQQRTVLENLAQALGVRDRIMMPGFANDTRGWLAHASLLVCPSKREGFGNVIAEALACGVPVVATDCPCGPAEILQDGEYGRLVPVDDVDLMAQAIIETLDDVKNASKLRDRAQHFTVARCIDAYGGLIDTLRSRV